MKKRHRRRKSSAGMLIRLCIVVILLALVKKEYDKYEFYNGETDSEIVNEAKEEVYNVPDNDTANQLKSMVKQDKRMKVILKNYNNYPEELLEMLSRNIEMLDYVLNYTAKKGNVYSDTIGKVHKGSAPLLLQWDPRWGYADYGNKVLAITGCGPTCLSMVIADLTGDNSVTPYKVAEYAEENGYYVSGSGTGWNLFTEGSRHFGIQGNSLSLSESSMRTALQSGQPVVCSMGPGDFTTVGHFIVLTGLENEKFVVHDPNSEERSRKLWDYKALEKQIKNLWAFTAIQ